jgi:hypothetical protein
MSMLPTLTAADLTFVFISVVIGLGSAFVAMLWRIERTPPRSRRRK